MKRILFLIAAVVTLTAAQASETTVSEAVQSAFTQDFKNAADVKWSQTAGYNKAQFQLNNQYVTAYYDVTAHLVAVVRNITMNQLPLILQTKVKLKKDSQWIADLFELNDDNGTTYYVTVEDGDAKITYRSNGSGEWTEYRKVEKS